MTSTQKTRPRKNGQIVNENGNKNEGVIYNGITIMCFNQVIHTQATNYKSFYFFLILNNITFMRVLFVLRKTMSRI